MSKIHYFKIYYFKDSSFFILFESRNRYKSFEHIYESYRRNLTGKKDSPFFHFLMNKVWKD